SIEMSTGTATARPPALRMPAATVSALSPSRSPTTTRAPSSPSRVAAAAPMPEPPPAIATTLSVRPRTFELLLEAEWERLEAPDRGAVLPRHVARGDREPQFGEPGEQRRQRHLQLDARQVRAEAVVRPVPEAELEDVGPVHVDLVGVGEHGLVA